MLVQLAISGQYMENYGAHSWDGQGECPQYWKAKGGETIVMVCNVNPLDIQYVSRELEERMSDMSWSNEGSSCYFNWVDVYPNKLARNDFIAWEFKAYDEVESMTQAEIREFLEYFGDDPLNADPRPLPYEEYEVYA